MVGGGVAGMISAILLQKKFGSVCLIERENKLGGLYQSSEFNEDIYFDQGSHFLRETGIKQLDKIILKGVTKKQWRILGNLKGGAFYGSKLNSQTPFLDTRELPQKVYEKGIIELLNITKTENEPRNLKEQLYATFGETFTDKIFFPILYKKYFRYDLDKLSVDAHGLLGLNRILGFNPEATREIKSSEIYNTKFAFHSSKEGQSNLKNYYPINEGISLWITLLHKQLNDLGVKIITNREIKKLSQKQKRVNSVILNDGTQINCTSIVWTAPPSLFLKLSSIPIKIPKRSDTQLHTSLHNFVFDKPFLTDVHYIQCHDPKLKTFRITLYPNIQRNQNNIFHLTSEVISPEKADLIKLENQVLRELSAIGVIKKLTKPVFAQSNTLSQGFILPTLQIKKNTEHQINIISNHIDNIVTLGRAAGNNFTIDAVLRDLYKVIGQLTRPDFSH